MTSAGFEVGTLPLDYGGRYTFILVCSDGVILCFCDWYSCVSKEMLSMIKFNWSVTTGGVSIGNASVLRFKR
jgi:hypothetical protein